jgi:hypothetical protein
VSVFRITVKETRWERKERELPDVNLTTEGQHTQFHKLVHDRVVRSETLITQEYRDKEKKRVCCAHPNSYFTTRCPAYRCLLRAVNGVRLSLQRRNVENAGKQEEEIRVVFHNRNLWISSCSNKHKQENGKKGRISIRNCDGVRGNVTSSVSK